MSSQTTGSYRCEPCGMSFNSQHELDEHNHKDHNSGLA